jgi:hypothetical protein
MKQLKVMSESQKTLVQHEIDQWKSVDDPDIIMDEVDESLSNNHPFTTLSMSDFKAATLNEFENGVLMTQVIPDEYRTIAISMSRRLQEEYSCQRTSEKALVEMAVISYVRFLDTHHRMEISLTKQGVLSYNHDSCRDDKDYVVPTARRNACQRTELELKLINFLGKETDRAQRQYMMSIQMLQNLRQPQMQVNIRTQTAVIGQNQVVQSSNRE